MIAIQTRSTCQRSFAVLVAALLVTVARAEEPLNVALVEPLPYCVVQRQGFELRRASAHEPGGPQLGHANVSLRGDFPRQERSSYEYRLVTLPGAFGESADWRPLVASFDDDKFHAVARVPAGGWYRLEVRCLDGDRVTAVAAVEPIGVGEVFLVAGQSYAANHNDLRFKVEDPLGRVAAFDAQARVWRVAHDPQPTGDGSDGGSIWPPLGDMLSELLEVPVGFANVAVGATESAQWLPGTPNYDRLVAAGQQLGSFRAILWQQGESDVISQVSTATYVKNLTSIRTDADAAWKKSDIPWLLAKSTLHPTVYNSPAGEAKIRAAIDELCHQKGFRPGPDTDLLAGENRSPVGTRQHFSAVGQRRAALLWFASIWRELETSAADR